MALLDSVIREIDQHFGLGNKSAALVAEIVEYLFDAKQGGLAGFIDRFQKAGFGSVVKSWVAKNVDNQPVTPEQLDAALGNGPVIRLGSLFSLPGSTVRKILVVALPQLVDLLTPDGVVPESMPADVRAFLNSSAARYRPLPAATAPGESRDSRSVGPWVWAAALLWAGLLAYWALTGPDEAAAPQTTAVEPRAELPARLALTNTDGRVEYSGVVADEATRAGVLDRLRTAFGESNIAGRLDVDPRVGPAAWLDHLGELLGRFKIPGAELVLEGKGLKVGGWLSEAERTSWLNSIRSLFGGDFSFGLLGDKAVDATKAAYDRTLAALEQLKPGSGSKDVTDALNLWVINFETNSAAIPAESQTLIGRAAAAINAAPDAVVIEIAGHTDDTGDPAANLALSEARAKAVQDALVAAGVADSRLTAKGYGQDQPVAANDTEYGRFRNRRIEFRVQP